MGLGLSARAAAPQSKGFLRLGVFKSNPLATLAISAEEFAEERGLRELVTTTWEGEYLSVELHPLEEEIGIRLEDGELFLDARTSTLGPGYHAFVCDLLDRWTQTCGIHWQFDDEEFQDETGYFAHRSFERLQNEMAGWLAGLAGSVQAQLEAGATDLGVCVPMHDDVPILGDAIATPLGPRDPAWFETLAGTESAEEVRSAASEWFIWWEREADGTFWHRTGLGLAWTAIPWHAPDSAATQRLYELALSSLDRAMRLAPHLPFPSEAVAEMQAMLDDEEMSPPAPRGIGYFRLPWRRQLAESWSIVLPGYFYRNSEDDGDVLLHRDLTVHSTAFVAKGNAAEALADFREEGLVQESFEADGVAGHARWDWVPGEDLMLLEGVVAAEKEFLSVTMTFPDKAALPAALAAFRSIRFAPDDAHMDEDEDTDN